MPTITAAVVDRFLRPGDSESVDNSISCTRPPRKPIHIPKSNLDGNHSVSSVQKKVLCPQIKPALYATPDATPLPGSPTSFTPSPYVVNHKRRGPRLRKSFSDGSTPVYRDALDETKSSDNRNEAENGSADFSGDASVPSIMEPVNGVNELDLGDTRVVNESSNEQHQGSNMKYVSNNMVFGNNKLNSGLGVEDESVKLSVSSSQRRSDSEDFFDPKDSLSCTSNTDGEDNCATACSFRSATTVGEFYDAFEDLSSDGGMQSSLHDVDAELREMRLSLLMEIESRKQAEEALDKMRRQWEAIRQQLLPVGLTLPPMSSNEHEHPDVDPAEDLLQQVTVARFVSESIGRGIAKAEAEVEMESQIESKNFEIARLMDRLQYYEAVNREMSQRNQETIEMARINRLNRKRKRKWVWGSIAAAITLGTAALLWSYLPTSDGSSSTRHSEPLEHDETPSS